MKKLKKLYTIPAVKLIVAIIAVLLCFYIGVKTIEFLFPLIGFEKK